MWARKERRTDLHVVQLRIKFSDGATVIESSAQWCGWRLRFASKSKLSTVTKTFVVKGAEFRDGGGRAAGMARGGKVNSTCCRVHKNAELVPDSARMRMHVRSTRQVLDSEILVMYQVLTQAFSGECREGVLGKKIVARRALACFIGGHGGVPVVLLFLRTQINWR